MESGYYWIKRFKDSNWEVAYYDAKINMFTMFAVQDVCSANVVIWDMNRIKPPNEIYIPTLPPMEFITEPKIGKINYKTD